MVDHACREQGITGCIALVSELVLTADFARRLLGEKIVKDGAGIMEDELKKSRYAIQLFP